MYSSPQNQHDVCSDTLIQKLWKDMLKVSKSCQFNWLQGHKCFLSTTVMDVRRVWQMYWLWSEDIVLDDDVHNGCQHTQSVPSSSIWQITLEEAKYILTYKPDGTFLVWERSGKPVSDPSSTSINTHVISVVWVEYISTCHHGYWCSLLTLGQLVYCSRFVVRSICPPRYREQRSLRAS